MKKLGDLMKELGFRDDASYEAKKAFIKNLVRAADRKSPAPEAPLQLSFELDEPVHSDSLSRKAKASG